MEYPIYAEAGWTGCKAIHIKCPDNHTGDPTDAYHVGFPKSSQLEVRRGSDHGPVVGRVKFHEWQQYAEIWFEDNTRVEMRKDGLWAMTQVVDLPASPENCPFKWKRAGFLAGRNLKLVNAKGEELALFKKDYGWGPRSGRLIIHKPGLPQELLDQIFVTFMAMEEKQRIQQKQGGVGGGSPGIAGGI